MNHQVNLGSFWLPKQGSTIAPEIDFGWDVVMYLSIFFFIGTMGALIYFVMKYKRRGPNDITSQVDHSLPIEITWTVIPSVMVVGLFLVGFKGYISSQVPPADSYEIQVTAQKWLWTFTYPSGLTVPGELRVPKGRPVHLVMSSKDVLHSFFVPEFRVKSDVIPGQYTTLWFEAVEPMETVLFCTEYCGTDHSNMLAKVVVMEQKEFDEWLQGQSEPATPTADYGKKLFTANACNTCHSLDGSPKTGPTLQNIMGKEEKLADGSTVKVDENYILESILNPNAKVVAGFSPVMPTFKGILSEKQIASIITYLKDPSAAR